MERAWAIETFDRGQHLSGVTGALAAMKGQPYPGPIAGVTEEEHVAWLESIPLTHRYAAVSGSRQAIGHVALSPGGNNAVSAGLPPIALEITRLFVHPQWRRQGVASALLEHATCQAYEAGPGAVLVVSADLHDARRLYEAHGWHETARAVSRRTRDQLVIYAHQGRG